MSGHVRIVILGRCVRNNFIMPRICIKKAPKENGFYWLRRKGKKDTIVSIWDSHEGLKEFGAMVAWLGSDWDQSLCEIIKEFDCQWFGPLSSPFK